MTQKQPSCPYRDLAISDCYMGFPEICNLPNGALLASTWSGYCFEINPDSGHVTIQPRIDSFGITTLGCPSATATEPILCSAATHLIWTELWQLGAPETLRVETNGAVNSVALSPQGELLATGLGMYPLNPDDHPRAKIELFSTADPTEPLVRRVLPGVAVDRVVFHPTRKLLVTVTGARSQDRGHVILLDHNTLQFLDIAETNFFSCRTAIIDSDLDRLILAYRHGIEVRPLDQLWNVEWQWPAADELFGAAHDPERGVIFLSNGKVLSLDSKKIARLPALDKCTGLAVLDDGRLVGISRTGMLRVWETGPEWEPQ